MIKLSDLIAKTYQPINLTKIHQLDEGGRACTKSSKNATTISQILLSDANSEVIVVRQDSIHHRDSTLKELIIAFERLGLEQGIHFDYKFTPMELRIIATNQVIKFGAMNDVEKLKGFKPSARDKYFVAIWFFEISEFKSDYDMEQVISTFMRGNKPYFNCFYELNPPASKAHWYYEWREKVKKRDDFDVRFRTYLDLTDWEKENWLGNILLKQIENLKKIDIEQYKHIYLGMTRKLTGAIYKKFDIDKHVKEFEYSFFNEYQAGLDYGENDAVSCCLVGFDGARQIHVKAQYYHRNTKDEMDINDYAEAVDKWLREQVDIIRQTKKSFVLDVYVDSANLSFRKLLDKKAAKDVRYRVKAVDKRKSVDVDRMKKKDKYSTSKDYTAIQERIDFINLMIGCDRYSIDPSCKPLIEEMETAIYTEDGRRKDDSTSRVDSQDSQEYAVKNKMPMIREWVLSKER